MVVHANSLITATEYTNFFKENEVRNVSGWIPDGITSVYITDDIAEFTFNGQSLSVKANCLNYLNKSVSNLEKIIEEGRIAVIQTVNGNIMSITFHPNIDVKEIKKLVIRDSAQKCVLLSQEILLRNCQPVQYVNLSNMVKRNLQN